MEGTQPSMCLLPQVCRSGFYRIVSCRIPGDPRTSRILFCHPLPSWSVLAATSHRNQFCSAPFQVSVALSSSSIRVAVLEESGERVLMEGKFTHKVNTESSLWSLEPGKCVLVSAMLCAPREALPSGCGGSWRLLFRELGFLVSPFGRLFTGDIWDCACAVT